MASDQVIQTELDRHKDILAKGITWFGRRKKEATATSTTASSTATKKAPGKLTRFLAKLGDMLGVDEDAKAKGILYAYLAGDFRGTKQSLKRLVDDDRLQKPLMVDIWQFYRAERLHLLQVLLNR